MDVERTQQLLIDLGACGDARLWAKGKTLAEVWEQCERVDWLLWVGSRMCGKSGWPNRLTIVSVACDCAELALPYVKSDDRPRLTIEITRAWVRGEAKIEQVKAARYVMEAAAAYYAYDDANAAEAVYSAAEAAAAAATAYANAPATGYVADAALAAIDAAYDAAAYDAAAYDAAAYDAAAAARKRMRAKCLAITKARLSPECCLNTHLARKSSSGSAA